MKTLKLFKDLIKSNYLDGYLVPKNDEYFNEYSNPNRLFSISNFSGSAGMAMIFKKKIICLWMADTKFKLKKSLEEILKF